MTDSQKANRNFCTLKIKPSGFQEIVFLRREIRNSPPRIYFSILFKSSLLFLFWCEWGEVVNFVVVIYLTVAMVKLRGEMKLKASW